MNLARLRICDGCFLFSQLGHFWLELLFDLGLDLCRADLNNFLSFGFLFLFLLLFLEVRKQFFVFGSSLGLIWCRGERPRVGSFRIRAARLSRFSKIVSDWCRSECASMVGVRIIHHIVSLRATLLSAVVRSDLEIAGLLCIGSLSMGDCTTQAHLHSLDPFFLSSRQLLKVVGVLSIAITHMVIDVKVELSDRNFTSSIRADDLNLACFRQRFIVSAEEQGNLELLRVVKVHHLRVLLGHSKGVEHLGSF